MGVHSLGLAHRESTGFDGPLGWVSNNLLLSNFYYQNVVGGSSGASETKETMAAAPDWSNNFIDNRDLSNVPSRWQWEQNSFIMLDSDIALVRDFSSAIHKNTGLLTRSFPPPATSSDSTVTGCPFASLTSAFVAQYKNDENLWLPDLRDVFTEVFNHGYGMRVVTNIFLIIKTEIFIGVLQTLVG